KRPPIVSRAGVGRYGKRIDGLFREISAVAYPRFEDVDLLVGERLFRRHLLEKDLVEEAAFVRLPRDDDGSALAAAQQGCPRTEVESAFARIAVALEAAPDEERFDLVAEEMFGVVCGSDDRRGEADREDQRGPNRRHAHGVFARRKHGPNSSRRRFRDY